ncbi:hypothetical protein CONPUDRAFT_155566 [Coniophora puteana RWD-64-598 SS2]|uniref:Uncharacterized protein n=1 Tax=Coniophora puteana (strain RWD-64-598) TaxID=741705 RepID=A0A5M3MI18_CONPW|nr:uncharacterized protein CONPUDRAFT_155566 [Coniophora puteana RWD-64-598 SS2]EIW78852.1 hypothetical protein CONPUDRAFT_155566 [Coniophora puteana RWD-64-598 SS2]
MNSIVPLTGITFSIIIIRMGLGISTEAFTARSSAIRASDGTTHRYADSSLVFASPPPVPAEDESSNSFSRK